MKSFWESFDQDNLSAANKDVASLLGAAQFSNKERVAFLSDIRKKLNYSNISLDALKDFV